MREYRTLKVPSLVGLSAEVIANSSSGTELLCGGLKPRCASPTPSSSSPSSSISSSSTDENGSDKRDSVKLPMPCAEEILCLLCQKLKEKESGSDEVATALRPFLNRERCPVSRINLAGLALTNPLVSDVLRAQQENLRHLDLSLCTVRGASCRTCKQECISNSIYRESTPPDSAPFSQRLV